MASDEHWTERVRDWIARRLGLAFLPTGFVLIMTGLALAVTFSPWWLLVTVLGALVIISMAYI